MIDIVRREVATLAPGDGGDFGVSAVMRIERGASYHLARSARECGIALLVRGRARFESADGAIDLGPGGVYLVLPGVPFAMRSRGRGHTVLRCVVPGAKAIAALAADPGLGAWQVTSAAAIGELMEQLWHEARAAQPHASTVCAGHLQAMVGLLRRTLAAGGAGSTGRREFERCRAVADREYAHLADATALAAACALSRVHLARLFRRYAGTTPYAYLEARRMDQARALLALGDRSVAAIAEELGYRSPFTFSRAFKRVVGVAPSRWQKLPYGGCAP